MLNTKQIIHIALARLAGDSNYIEKSGYKLSEQGEKLVKLAMKQIKQQ